MSDEGLSLEWTGSAGRATVALRNGAGVIHVDELRPGSAKHRAAFLDAIRAKTSDHIAEQIETQLVALAAQLSLKEKSQPDEQKPRESAEAKSRAEEYLHNPDLMTLICDDSALLGVAGERALSATIYLVGTSRLLSKPLAAIVQGPSSSGKSFIIETVARLFPPEEVIFATQMTPQSLFHMKPGTLQHKFIVGGERSRLETDESADATRALREMLSSGRLSKLMPVKAGGIISTRSIEQEGPIAYVESTTLSEIFDEDKNRCLLLSTDETVKQTERILASMARRAAGVAPTRQQLDEVIATHHALQRMLDKADVIIPFAPEIQQEFSISSCEARRAFGQVLSVIQAVALLHQKQRIRDSENRLIAEIRDYEIAERLLREPLSRCKDEVPPAARRLYELLLVTGSCGVITTTEARRIAGCSRSVVLGYLRSLCEAGYVEETFPARGNSPAQWRVNARTQGKVCSPLPSASLVSREVAKRSNASV